MLGPGPPGLDKAVTAACPWDISVRTGVAQFSLSTFNPCINFASRRELPMAKAETLSYSPRSEIIYTEYCSFAISHANFNDTFVVVAVFVKEFLRYQNWMGQRAQSL